MVKAMECMLYQQLNQVIEFDCILANISQSGICILTTDALQDGQNITIRNHIFPHARTAIVRWCKAYNGLYYISGLEFQ